MSRRSVEGPDSGGATDVRFRGSQHTSLTGEGDLLVPDIWRAGLGESVVVTPVAPGDQETYLAVWPSIRFDDEVNAAVSGGPVDEDERRLARRWLLARTADASVDDQGLISIPEFLLQATGLRESEGQVLMVGVGSHLEVWPAGTDLGRASLRNGTLGGTDCAGRPRP